MQYRSVYKHSLATNMILFGALSTLEESIIKYIENATVLVQ